MRIAVTGGTGFIGAYICRDLRAAGHDLRVMARARSDTSFVATLDAEIVTDDLADPGDLAGFVKGADVVVHDAVDFRACRDDQRANFRTNLLVALDLLELSRQAGAKQFIFISTGAVHERILDDRPLDEAHPLWPGSTYGAYKAAVEAFLPAYREQFGFNACAFRPTSVYGLHLTRPAASQWFGLVRGILRGENFASERGGKIVHVEDVAQAVVRAVGRDDVAGEVYELTDCHIYDQTVAEFARQAAGSDATIEDLKGSGPRHQIVSDKARAALRLGLNRGRDGVREYVHELVRRMAE